MRTGGRVPALTGIRTVAALAVCLTHAAYWTGHYTDDYLGRLLSRFEVGVAIFFVLSGYLLFSPWVRALHDARGDRPAAYPPLRRYAWHRVRRIVPAYWITVIGVYVIFLFRDDVSDFGQGWAGLLRNLTFTQVYGLGHLHTGLTQMWSMAAEVAYYVALPAVAWPIAAVACRGRWRPDLLLVCLGGLLLVSPIWTIAVHGSAGVDLTARLWPPAFASWFVGGMILAVLARLVTRWPAWPSVVVAVVAFLITGGAVAGEATIVPDDAGAAVVKHGLYLVIAVGLVAPLTIADDDPWARLCGSRPMVWFGEISYEFFLVHVMVLELVMDLLGYSVFTGSTLAAFATTTAISIPVAWALHRITAPLWRNSPATSVGTRR
ncbi:acyltransferase family protein [Gordonia hydrophobica]|uniref:Acyltransferase n=1 Tax=Gordonia hydrophobica TaxID=40516 RepID=A0ABZ2U4K1_9ACTN|nr:acyltransferase [Gordonia hydrophobica]MBM7368286.1 peptidoglycan/LPS O-acetylase OafA/YrhL [Gordonia hydrophobica]